MSGTHSDLFSEIGKLVVAAHGGQPIDLTATSEELASRYAHLNVSADVLARAVARSLGAVGVSMALIAERRATGAAGEIVPFAGAPAIDKDAADDPLAEAADPRAAIVFPSGVRLAVLS